MCFTICDSLSSQKLAGFCDSLGKRRSIFGSRQPIIGRFDNTALVGFDAGAQERIDRKLNANRRSSACGGTSEPDDCRETSDDCLTISCDLPRLKTAVVPPIPSASVRIAMDEKPGFFESIRKAKRRSAIRFSAQTIIAVPAKARSVETLLPK
jgi:hypothetical protein